MGGLTIWNEYFYILLFLQSTMAEYLSYEETAAFIEATKWKGYNFLSSEDVYKNISAIPDELYGKELICISGMLVTSFNSLV